MEAYRVLELKSICKTPGDNVEEIRQSELCEKTLMEYEQRMQQEVRDSAMLRLQRKAARAGIAAKRVKRSAPSLSPKGDMLMFDGKSYSLYYAHGGLQIDRTFKMDLRKKGYSSDERREIFEQVNILVAESPSIGNIFGAIVNQG
jgi:hypothetical protein